MILVRAPLRISLFGGGTDLPDFYRVETGSVLSAAINKYVWLAGSNKFDGRIRVGYSCTENVLYPREIKHDIIRAAVESCKSEWPDGLELVTVADVPAQGSGLGSSSALAVAVSMALQHLSSGTISSESTKYFLARRACQIELDLCNKPIGKQDQYAAAFGGINLIRFYPNEEVEMNKLENSGVIKRLLSHLLILYVGKRMISADEILRDQIEMFGSQMSIYRQMANIAESAFSDLENDNISRFGTYLLESWEMKRKLSRHISSPNIDAMYEKAIKIGAQGGKLLGAGSGGFLLFYASPEYHARIEVGLGLKRLNFDFDYEGCKVVYDG